MLQTKFRAEYGFDGETYIAEAKIAQKNGTLDQFKVQTAEAVADLITMFVEDIYTKDEFKSAIQTAKQHGGKDKLAAEIVHKQSVLSRAEQVQAKDSSEASAEGNLMGKVTYLDAAGNVQIVPLIGSLYTDDNNNRTLVLKSDVLAEAIEIPLAKGQVSESVLVRAQAVITAQLSLGAEGLLIGETEIVALIMEQISQPNSPVYILQDNPEGIRGFANKDGRFVAEGIINNPDSAVRAVGIFHETAEGVFAKNSDKLPKDISAHTYLRGCGETVRVVVDNLEAEGVLQNITTSQEFIIVVKAELEYKGLRSLTADEVGLIEYNFANNKGENTPGKTVVFGLQDRLFGENVNRILTATLKQMKPAAANIALIQAGILSGEGTQSKPFRLTTYNYSNALIINFQADGINYIVELGANSEITGITSSIVKDGTATIIRSHSYEDGVMKAQITEPIALVEAQLKREALINNPTSVTAMFEMTDLGVPGQTNNIAVNIAIVIDIKQPPVGSADKVDSVLTDMQKLIVQLPSISGTAQQKSVDAIANAHQIIEQFGLYQ